MALPYDHWLLLAFAFDDYLAELKKQQAKTRKR